LGHSAYSYDLMPTFRFFSSADYCNAWRFGTIVYGHSPPIHPSQNDSEPCWIAVTLADIILFFFWKALLFRDLGITTCLDTREIKC
jgi:hypothetical protein